MNSRERLLTALMGGKPDRLPVTIHQWQKYHLDKYMGGASELEACRRSGLDAQVQFLQGAGQFWWMDGQLTLVDSPEWRYQAAVTGVFGDETHLDHRIDTPEGSLTYKTASNPKTSWVTEYIVKRDEDLDLIEKFMPAPALDLKTISRLRRELGGDGILRGFVWGDQAGCWQHACLLKDVNSLILDCFDKPDWVHRFMRVLLDKKLRFVETMRGAELDLVETGGGAASSTLISPKIHREFCLPYDREMHDALHGLGFRITYHTCGGTRGIEECIVENGTDASETLAPLSIGGNQEPWDYAKKIAGRVALIGGLDQFSVLTEDTPEMVRAKVHELFEKVGQNGGYICSTADHFFEAPVENIQAMAAAARDCGY